MAGKEYHDAAAYGMAMDAKKKAAKKEKKAPKKPAPKKSAPKKKEPKDASDDAPVPGYASGKGMQAPQAGKTRTVVKGETLSEIAELAGVTVAAIKAANPQIKGTTIIAGKKIKIPKKAEK